MDFRESMSLLKNYFAPFSNPRSQAESAVSWVFLARFETTDRSGGGFFNSVPWPLPGHPEAMKMNPSPS
jgi:hypothetical protein